VVSPPVNIDQSQHRKRAVSVLGQSPIAHLGKVATFEGLGALPASLISKGLIVGAALMARSFLARSIVLRISPARYKLLIDGLILSSGLSLIWASLR
jgi:hypothetical protein